MSDHEELVAEMATVEKMPIAERLKLAKKRRAMQLKNLDKFEKQLNKDKDRKSKRSTSSEAVGVAHRKTNQLRFVDSILLLDAAVKNDLVEGKVLVCCVSTSVWSWLQSLSFICYTLSLAFVGNIGHFDCLRRKS